MKTRFLNKKNWFVIEILFKKTMLEKNKKIFESSASS